MPFCLENKREILKISPKKGFKTALLFERKKKVSKRAVNPTTGALFFFRRKFRLLDKTFKGSVKPKRPDSVQNYTILFFALKN